MLPPAFAIEKFWGRRTNIPYRSNGTVNHSCRANGRSRQSRAMNWKQESHRLEDALLSAYLPSPTREHSRFCGREQGAQAGGYVVDRGAEAQRNRNNVGRLRVVQLLLCFTDSLATYGRDCARGWASEVGSTPDRENADDVGRHPPVADGSAGARPGAVEICKADKKSASQRQSV
ncbi:hypothetical protein OBBRIDRAFT_801897 [Obba rivulosa]|uniref:Uncharacterized protein n=1 Tax=Obba rivulosa TaxID=1052685 RepID=A0A8E2DPJ4_9APHY|nr:hypothetical protein OBBRIDRAFT_801897 [Obba rivulosa]